ncbi:hypothetical protein [Algoriphagus chordae]|uniref:Uncharacterized protein n=1 Tax=Algoriphagus chordae TaxID=237019 RepID=A0A2W7QK00_9BACT|nr:hypothetical protein [Algoriphagus chordae]PZX48683.1 hypothetical protein LV85_03497 [Algoriphagus chordae]
MNLNHWITRCSKSLTVLGLLLFTLGFLHQVSAQRRPDHITLNDSAYTEGYIKINNSNPLKSVFFKWKKKDAYQEYSIKEVSEFYENHRNYQRKTFDYKGEKVTVFLEKLVYENKDISVYKWIDKRGLFFIEKENGMSLLGEDFKEEISIRLNNPNLDPLLEISKLNYNSLTYLLTVANNTTEPQTFSRFFRITPQVGISFSSHQLTIPNQNSVGKLSGTATNLSLNFEFLPSYKRNLSLNLTPAFSSGYASGFNSYKEGESRFETDLQFDYTIIQLPMAAKYYIEMRPNKYRAFVEMGYSWSSMKANNGKMDIAEFRENIIATGFKEFDPSSPYYGFNAGVGLDKSLKKTRAITIGMKYSSLRNKNSDKMNQLTPYIGFKF